MRVDDGSRERRRACRDDQRVDERRLVDVDRAARRHDGQPRVGREAEPRARLLKERSTRRVNRVGAPHLAAALAERARADEDPVGAGAQEAHDEAVGLAIAADDVTRFVASRQGHDPVEGGDEVGDHARPRKAQLASVSRSEWGGQRPLRQSRTLEEDLERVRLFGGFRRGGVAVQSAATLPRQARHPVEWRLPERRARQSFARDSMAAIRSANRSIDWRIQ